MGRITEKDKHNRTLERRLRTLERHTLSELRDHVSRTRSTSAHDATEFMDVASDSELDDLAARIAEWDSMTIDEIEDALKMLREGRYGTCRICGKRITKRRLEACPFATLCIVCKEVQERQSMPERYPDTRQYGADMNVDLGGGMDEEETPAFDDVFRDPNFSDIV